MGTPRWSLFGGLLELGASPENVWTEETTGPSGAWYQIEVQLLWDDKSQGHIRVLASIDDGGRTALYPMTDDFIVAPDGRFIGE